MEKWEPHRRAKFEARNLVAEPVGPAPEPVVVGQALDRPYGTNGNILQGSAFT